jgi:hypothetical protein
VVGRAAGGAGGGGGAARVERGGAKGAAPAIASTRVGAIHARHVVKAYTWPGSNWRPSACEADVIATRPQVLLTPCHRRGLLGLFASAVVEEQAGEEGAVTQAGADVAMEVGRRGGRGSLLR